MTAITSDSWAGEARRTYEKGGAMPYQSEKQRRFMAGCRHDPAHMEGKCPDAETLRKFEEDDAKLQGQRRALERMAGGR